MTKSKQQFKTGDVKYVLGGSAVRLLEPYGTKEWRVEYLETPDQCNTGGNWKGNTSSHYKRAKKGDIRLIRTCALHPKKRKKDGRRKKQ